MYNWRKIDIDIGDILSGDIINDWPFVFKEQVPFYTVAVLPSKVYKVSKFTFEKILNDSYYEIWQKHLKNVSIPDDNTIRRY